MLQAITSKRFRLLRKLGEGGMGEVYEALDTERNERVALKLLRNTNAESIVRFKREFRALQDIHHPNLVTLGDLVSEGDRWFFSMELITGVDFVSWVRVLPRSAYLNDSTASTKLADRLAAEAMKLGFDEGRLRAGLVQLVRAIDALHAAQMVHRDIKPSNVLVTPEGRVVVLDFGLVTEETHEALATTTEVAVVGTPAYMAPEQAASRPASAPADWYSVGALLYEAITGQTPFVGAPLEILLAKQRNEPPAASALLPQVPRDLDALCTQLLRFDPQARAGAAQILRTLDSPETRGTRLSTATHFAVFVGRDAELEALRAAYTDARTKRGVTVLVHGESGIGKTWLVRQFAETLVAQEHDLVVLAGRCFERESVPYKAFDGVIDALSRYMGRLPIHEALSLLPTRPAALAQLFPVLRRIDAIAQAPQLRQDGIAPQELRSRAFTALREVFTRLADRRPILITIDDLQWADEDSIALLGEIVRPPDGPNLLLVATLRSPSGETAESARTSLDLATQLRGDVQNLHLGPLSTEHSRALARALIERTAPELPVSVDTIAGEAGGHPLFIDEIVRHLFLVGAPATSALRLEEALWTRIEALDASTRKLVELVSVAGTPLAQDVIAVALDVTPGEFARLTSFLRVAHLVKTSGSRGGDTIEPYHSRVRNAVLARLDEDTVRALHRKIAIALESSGSADDRAMAAHWEGAGARGDAAKHMLRAAEQASETLAFDRAAKLYERALTLRSESTTHGDRDAERAIERKWADALAMAGRGPLAAKAYAAAAIGATPVEALELKRLSAEHLLRSGHLDEGLAATRLVLGSVGIPFPATPLRALVMLLVFRLFLSLRGFSYKARDTSEISARDLTRIDVCWSVAVALCLVDPIRGALFQERHMILALRAGNPYRVARAYAIRISIAGMGGASAGKKIDAMIKHAENLSTKCGSAHALAWSKATAGAAYYITGRFRESLACTRAAEEIFRNEVVGSAGEVFPVRLFTLQSLAMLGRLKDLAAEQPVTLREAIERGDRYGAVNARIGMANLVWLIANQPEIARQQCTEAIGEWSTEGFHLEHYYALLALTHIDLYEGRAKGALRRIDEEWRTLRKSLITRVQFVRITCHNLRGRAALAVATESKGDHKALLQLVESDAAAIERERAPWATPTALLLRAGIQAVRRRPDTMRTHLEHAARLFDENDMVLHAHVARGALGARIGGQEGRAIVGEVEKWMRGQAIAKPARMLSVFAPGLEIP